MDVTLGVKLVVATGEKMAGDSESTTEGRMADVRDDLEVDEKENWKVDLMVA